MHNYDFSVDYPCCPVTGETKNSAIFWHILLDNITSNMHALNISTKSISNEFNKVES